MQYNVLSMLKLLIGLRAGTVCYHNIGINLTILVHFPIPAHTKSVLGFVACIEVQ